MLVKTSVLRTNNGGSSSKTSLRSISACNFLPSTSYGTFTATFDIYQHIWSLFRCLRPFHRNFYALAKQLVGCRKITSMPSRKACKVRTIYYRSSAQVCNGNIEACSVYPIFHRKHAAGHFSPYRQPKWWLYRVWPLSYQAPAVESLEGSLCA